MQNVLGEVSLTIIHRLVSRKVEPQHDHPKECLTSRCFSRSLFLNYCTVSIVRTSSYGSVFFFYLQWNDEITANFQMITADTATAYCVDVKLEDCALANAT